MWNERQCRERRIGAREIFWSWALVALIVLVLAAWAALQALFAQPATLLAPPF